MPKITDLKFDKHNFNLHTEEGMELLAKSVNQNGFGRSVLVDKDNNLLAGNGIVETAIKQGKTKIKVVETTGEELVVVKRTDLDINTEQGRRMALADNVTAHLNLKWNEDELRAAREAWNVDVEDLNINISDNGETWDNLDPINGNLTPNSVDRKANITIVLDAELRNNREEIKKIIIEALKDYKGYVIK